MMLATLAAQPRHGLSEWLVSWRSGQACNGSPPPSSPGTVARPAFFPRR